jgi:hypothetical protein
MVTNVGDVINEDQDQGITRPSTGFISTNAFTLNNIDTNNGTVIAEPMFASFNATALPSSSLPGQTSPSTPTASETVTDTDVIIGEGNTVIQTPGNATIYINNNNKDTIYITEVTKEYIQQFITNSGTSTPGGNTAEIQFNSNGSFAASNQLVFDVQTGTLISTDARIGNITVGSTAFLGNVANVHIDGGINSYVLTTDGQGNLSWSAPATGNGTVGGAFTTLQFNDNGNFGGINTTSYDGANLSLGQAQFLKILGGASGQVLTTDGTGNLSWSDSSSGLLTITSILTGGIYNVTSDEEVLVIRAAAPITIVLATPVQVGRRIIIKDFVGNNRVGNNISILGTGGDTVDGEGGFSIDEPYNVISVVGVSSTEWMIL